MQRAQVKRSTEEAKAYTSVINALKAKQASPLQLQLLKALTLPGEFPWPRVSSAFGSDPTATAKLYRKPNLRYSSTALPGDLANRNTTAFAFRDALRSGLYSFGLSALDVAEYVADFESNAALGTTDYYPRYVGPAVLDDTTSNVNPHGNYLYPGRLGPSDPCRGWIVSQGGNMELTIPAFAGLPAGTIVEVTLRRFAATSWEDVLETNFDPTVGIVFVAGINVTGYYAWSFSTRLVAPTAGPAAPFVGSVRLINNGATSSMMWAQLALPNLEDVIQQVKSYTITALSLMYTNTASPLNRQGQIVGLQLPRGANPLTFIEFDELANDAKAKIMDVVNGMYGFAKPTNQTDFDKQVFQFAASFSRIDQDYVFPLIPESDFLVINAQVVDPNGRQGYWTFDHNVEYISISQWADLRSPAVEFKELEASLAMMSQIPQWHENSLHLSDIWDGIKNVASKVWEGVKDVASVAAPLAPLAMALL
jgi:hypothetical protein